MITVCSHLLIAATYSMQSLYIVAILSIAALVLHTLPYYSKLVIFALFPLFPGQQPSGAAGLTLSQTQGSIFGAQSNQQQQLQQPSQPQFNFGSTTQQQQQASSFNFSAGSGSGLGMGSAPNANPSLSLGFPPSNSGGLNFAAPSLSGAGTRLVAGIGQSSSSSSSSLSDNNSNKQQQGFQFNPNAGISFNFGGGQGVVPMAPVGSGESAGALLFSAGSSQTSTPPSARVIKKARRRKN